ncbi:VOC family protein [Uliginosibacterium aquaticum]|uniref:VOC family protein n=1 Tax=Uliginosibacterium aquaticum TaxID=2731212 RepID=A0ABX2IHE3_9RHOO|nr:VOC family protein [Uliginosibacterium aquaticum]NSL54432.1 VOC family protein [Uliginosibacterium aquaticum]
MTILNTYLNFPGTAEEAFSFYKSVFGGEFATLMRYKDGPGCPEGGELPPELGDKILHISLPIGANMLMASDALPPLCPPVTTGSNVSLSLHPESEAEARRLFAALSEGGQVQMPFQPMFWGALFGMCADRFGILWMVNFELPKA